MQLSVFYCDINREYFTAKIYNILNLGNPVIWVALEEARNRGRIDRGQTKLKVEGSARSSPVVFFTIPIRSLTSPAGWKKMLVLPLAVSFNR